MLYTNAGAVAIGLRLYNLRKNNALVSSAQYTPGARSRLPPTAPAISFTGASAITGSLNITASAGGGTGGSGIVILYHLT